MTNLIPMAGDGNRFKEAGFKIPKPLINVSGKPMIINAVAMMPNSDDWLFICRKEHIDEFKIDKEIKKYITNAKFLTLDYLTEGQASTCLLSKGHIDHEKPLFIGACDNGMKFDYKKYEELIKEKDTDIICFGFTKQIKLLCNPNAWGWIKVKKDRKTIENISVKIPISDNPYNDFAVVGSFYFRKAKIFFEIVEDLIKNNVRINNEFYVDSCVNQGIEMGYKAKIFVLDHYIGWGTPIDLKEYESWESYFKND